MGRATKALMPVQRKNSHIHQPEIVFGKDISHSPVIVGASRIANHIYKHLTKVRVARLFFRDVTITL